MRKLRVTICMFLFAVSVLVMLRYNLPSVNAKPEDSWIIVPISTWQPGDQDEPSISGNIITWRTEGQNGFVYDLSTGNGTPLGMRPNDVSGHLVACTYGYPRAIVVYNVSDGTYIHVTDGSADDWITAIDGARVVWTDTRNGEHIYMYDLIGKMETQITSGTAEEDFPDISGDKIVYRRFQNGVWSVWLYDLSTERETMIATNQSMSCFPTIDGDRVVWTGENGHVEMYTISTGTITQISASPFYEYSPSISGDMIAWTNTYGGPNQVYAYNLTSHEETMVSYGGLYFHGVSNGRIVFSNYANDYLNIFLAVLETEILSVFRVETDKSTYLSGENVYISGGFTFETAATGVLLNITVLSSTSENPVYTVYSNYINVVEGQRMNFTDLNGGKPFQWNTSANLGSFKIRATIHMDSPYHCNAIEDSQVFNFAIVVTVNPTFNDNKGAALYPAPTIWTIRLPNGTLEEASGPVTYRLTQGGDISIVSIIWKGVEIVPEVAPSRSLASDTSWAPEINCLLPTSLSTSISSSTTYIGFKVEISGNLTCNEVGLPRTPILLSSSVTGGESWNDITLINTTSAGDYSAVWMPSATGNYLVRAMWAGNPTYPGTTTIVNLAVIPFKEQNVFSVTSNSTVSELAFNSTSRELSFTVTGPSGTTGYVGVYIAKSLVDNITDVKVYLDGAQLSYTATSLDDSWLLHFTYTHSSHKVIMNLGQAPFIPPQLMTPLSLGIIAVAVTIAMMLLLFRIRRGKPPTILDRLFIRHTQLTP